MLSTGTPPPVPTQVNLGHPLGSIKYVEAMWESVGSRYPMGNLTGGCGKSDRD